MVATNVQKIYLHLFIERMQQNIDVLHVVMSLRDGASTGRCMLHDERHKTQMTATYAKLSQGESFRNNKCSLIARFMLLQRIGKAKRRCNTKTKPRMVVCFYISIYLAIPKIVVVFSFLMICHGGNRCLQ